MPLSLTTLFSVVLLVPVRSRFHPRHWFSSRVFFSSRAAGRSLQTQFCVQHSAVERLRFVQNADGVQKRGGKQATNEVGGPLSLGLGAHAGVRSFVRWGCKSSRVASRPRLASSPRPPRHLARIYRLVSVQRPTTGSAWNSVLLQGECEKSSEREFFGELRSRRRGWLLLGYVVVLCTCEWWEAWKIGAAVEPVSAVHLCILKFCLGEVVCVCGKDRPSRVRGRPERWQRRLFLLLWCVVVLCMCEWWSCGEHWVLGICAFCKFV